MDPNRLNKVFGWLVGEHRIFFYADDRHIAGQYQIWVQTALVTMVIIFERFGLQTNLNKTKYIICTPGFIWGKQGAKVNKRRAIG